jgi:hypothetical protein
MPATATSDATTPAATPPVHRARGSTRVGAPASGSGDRSVIATRSTWHADERPRARYRVPVLTGPRFGGKYAAPMDLGQVAVRKYIPRLRVLLMRVIDAQMPTCVRTIPVRVDELIFLLGRRLMLRPRASVVTNAFPTFDQAHGLIECRPIQFDGRRPSLLTAFRPDVGGRTEHDIARRRTYGVAELFDQAVDLAGPNCAADMSPERPRSRRASHPRANRGGHVRVG